MTWFNTWPGAATAAVLTMLGVVGPAKLLLDRELRRRHRAIRRIIRRSAGQSAELLQETVYRTRLRGEAWLTLVEQAPPFDREQESA